MNSVTAIPLSHEVYPPQEAVQTTLATLPSEVIQNILIRCYPCESTLISTSLVSKRWKDCSIESIFLSRRDKAADAVVFLKKAIQALHSLHQYDRALRDVEQIQATIDSFQFEHTFGSLLEFVTCVRNGFVEFFHAYADHQEIAQIGRTFDQEVRTSCLFVRNSFRIAQLCSEIAKHIHSFPGVSFCQNSGSDAFTELVKLDWSRAHRIARGLVPPNEFMYERLSRYAYQAPTPEYRVFAQDARQLFKRKIPGCSTQEERQKRIAEYEATLALVPADNIKKHVEYLAALVEELLAVGQIDRAYDAVDRLLSLVPQVGSISNELMRVFLALKMRSHFQKAEEVLRALRQVDSFGIYVLETQYAQDLLNKEVVDRVYQMIVSGMYPSLLKPDPMPTSIRDNVATWVIRTSKNYAEALDRLEPFWRLISASERGQFQRRCKDHFYQQYVQEKKVLDAFHVLTDIFVVPQMDLWRQLMAVACDVNQDQQLLSHLSTKQELQETGLRDALSEMLAFEYAHHDRVDEAVKVAERMPPVRRRIQHEFVIPKIERLIRSGAYEDAMRDALDLEEPNKSVLLARMFQENFMHEAFSRRVLEHIRLDVLSDEIRGEVIRLREIGEHRS